MLKRVLPAFCLAIFLAAAAPMSAAADDTADTGGIDVSAHAAVVVEPYTGTALYEKNADERMLVASTTKIMTALVVLERCALDEPVTVTMTHAAVEGSSMYLRPGEDYTVEDLLYGLLLASGNDAAAALADHCAGSMEAFAALMNEKCAALGLENTRFANAHGLDAEGHYSTARDLAVITAAAMEDPTFAKIFGTASHSVHGVAYANHNKLLTACPGCIGGKTGYTEAAGRILVSCVEREGMRLICVTISDPDDWADHAALYDACFAHWRYVPLPSARWQRVEVLSGMKSHARLRCSVPGVVAAKDAEVSLDVRLPRFVFAPVLAGTRAGAVTVTVDGETRETAELWYRETVAPEPAAALGAWERIRRFFAPDGGAGVYYLQN